MEPNKASLKKTGLVHSLQGYFLDGKETTGYFVDLEKRGINPNLKLLKIKFDDKYLAWPLSLKKLLKV